MVQNRENEKKNAGGFARGLLCRRLLDGKMYHVSTCVLGVPFPQNQLLQLVFFLNIYFSVMMQFPIFYGSEPLQDVAFSYTSGPVLKFISVIK